MTLFVCINVYILYIQFNQTQTQCHTQHKDNESTTVYCICNWTPNIYIYIYIYKRVECKYSRVPCKSYTVTTDGTDAVTHVLIYGSRQSRGIH